MPNRVQPRTEFDEEALEELTHSIREFGVFQPVVVREIEPAPAAGEPRYEPIMGERRFRASGRAGLEDIPAIVRSTADEHMLRDALLENLHRAQLNPLEEASAYQQLLADFGITQEQLANRIGRSRPQISNTIRLLKLPEPVQARVAAGVLSAGHARAILSLDGEAGWRRRHAAPRRQDRERGPVGARCRGRGGRTRRSRARSPARAACRRSSTRLLSVSATADARAYVGSALGKKVRSRIILISIIDPALPRRSWATFGLNLESPGASARP